MTCSTVLEISGSWEEGLARASPALLQLRGDAISEEGSGRLLVADGVGMDKGRFIMQNALPKRRDTLRTKKKLQ